MDIKKYTSIIIFKKHLVYKSVLDAILLHVKYIYIKYMIEWTLLAVLQKKNSQLNLEPKSLPENRFPPNLRYNIFGFHSSSIILSKTIVNTFYGEK